MGCYNGPNYKSIVQFYNASVQPMTEEPTPVQLIGSIVTDTGQSIGMNPDSVVVKHTGSYRFSTDINVNATAPGDVTVAMYKDGILLPETRRVFTLAVGNRLIHTETVRLIKTCCVDAMHNIQLMVSTDGAAAGDITFISGNAVKQA